MKKKLYATRAEFLEYISTETPVNTPDDHVIDALLDAACRHIDRKTGRYFVPLVQTLLYDVPDCRQVLLDEDLLELTAFTNGDGTAFTAAQYILPQTRNGAPYFYVGLRDIAGVMWQPGTNNTLQQAISVAGVWGYRHYYSTDAWESVTTLGAAIASTTTTSATLANTSALHTGDLLKVDSEFLYVTAEPTSLTALTVSRGDNGSTAATHLINSVVYRYVVEPDIHDAALIIAHAAYQRRHGVNTSAVATVTGAGVVISPQDIPATARALYEPYKRIVG